jgi:hypothetical protein
MTLLAALLLNHSAAAVLVSVAMALGFAGLFATVQLAQGAFTTDAINKLLAGDFLPIAASGVVDPHTPARYVITKAGVAALTLKAPVAGAEDGLLIEITSTTANAHTLTTVALFRNGGANTNVATFAAVDGASILLCAYNGKWYVQGSQNVTLTS